jgi:type I restriction enzyme S subunit
MKPDWKSFRLGNTDVATVTLGQSPPSQTYNQAGEGLPFFQGKADFGMRFPKVRMWCSAPLRVAEPGDILISVRAPVGDVNIAHERCAIGRGLAAIRPHCLDKEFLYYALLHAKPRIEAQSSGSTFDSINRHTLESLDIPAPANLAEQRQIALILNSVQKAIETESAICDKLADLKSATMAKLFREGLRGEPLKQTEIGEIPESWEVVRLGDLCSRIDYGTSQRCSEEPTAHPVLRIPNIIHGMIDTINLKYAEVGVLTEREIEKLRLVPGDLLFVRTNGNRQYTGRCAVYEGRPAGALFASYLIRVRLPSGAVDPFFVQQYLSEVGREQITRRANPAADGKFNVDTGILRDLKIPRPSLSEQQEIVAVLAALDERRRLAQRCHASLERLFSSVLNALMTGAIRVKDLDLAEVSHA